jgi:hypothetical protein
MPRRCATGFVVTAIGRRPRCHFGRSSTRFFTASTVGQRAAESRQSSVVARRPTALEPDQAVAATRRNRRETASVVAAASAITTNP